MVRMPLGMRSCLSARWLWRRQPGRGLVLSGPVGVAVRDARVADFLIGAREYWARIGHGSGLINFSGARFVAHEVSPDKALRYIALPMIMRQA